MNEKKLPPWLRNKLYFDKRYFETKKILNENNINTVCDEAKCPNRKICFRNKKATFLALGKYCTRNCRFCDIHHKENPPKTDPKEPEKFAKITKLLNLKHIVLTTVTRDDLKDHGTVHLKSIIKKINELNPDTTIELLSSDLGGDISLLSSLLEEKLSIFGHNIETVERLSPHVRSKANYQLSLKILKNAKKLNPSLKIKSGLMLGLGESLYEVKKAILDLKKSACDFICIGQYLKPSSKCIEVKEYIHPKIFQELEKFATEIGFEKVVSFPYARSSI